MQIKMLILNNPRFLIKIPTSVLQPLQLSIYPYKRKTTNWFSKFKPLPKGLYDKHFLKLLVQRFLTVHQ